MKQSVQSTSLPIMEHLSIDPLAVEPNCAGNPDHLALTQP